jgi:hypothetical protein
MGKIMWYMGMMGLHNQGIIGMDASGEIKEGRIPD